MTHSRRVKMAFALSIQTLLAQIGVPAFEHDRQQPQLIFFAQFRHTLRFRVISLSVGVQHGRRLTGVLIFSVTRFSALAPCDLDLNLLRYLAAP